MAIGNPSRYSSRLPASEGSRAPGRDDAEQIERIGAGQRHVLAGRAAGARTRAAARPLRAPHIARPRIRRRSARRESRPRASSRRQHIKISRHGGSHAASRASSFQKITPQRRSSVRTTCSTASSVALPRTLRAAGRRTSAHRPGIRHAEQRHAPLAAAAATPSACRAGRSAPAARAGRRSCRNSRCRAPPAPPAPPPPRPAACRRCRRSRRRTKRRAPR